MKRLLLTLIAVVALTCTALAQTFEVGNLTYTVRNSYPEQVTCVGLSTAGKEHTYLILKIPPMVTYNGNTYYVTQIGDAAFKGQTNIRGVVLQYGIERIGSEAFRECSNMTYANLPSTMKTIGSQSFAGCTSLENFYLACLELGEMVIYRNAFDDSYNRTLCVPWTASLENFRKHSALNTSSFPYIKHSSYAYDFSMPNGAMSIVTKRSTNISDPHEVTVIGFNNTAGGDGVADGKFTLPETDSPSSLDRPIKYVEVADSACAGNTKLTQIDFSAARSMTTINDYSFRGCPNLTSVKLSALYIWDGAFMDCVKLATAQWDERLIKIMDLGFTNCPITNDIVLPVGFGYIGSRVFKEAKSKFLLVPSTCYHFTTYALQGMSSLETMVINCDWAFDYDSFDLRTVPESCKLYVPRGLLNKAKKHVSWKRFSTINEGAYDFSYQGYRNSMYTMTVTSTKPFTLDGVDYAGKAKYVYNENTINAPNYRFDASEVNNMVGAERRYLMTEIGDSIMCNSTVEDVSFERMTYLERIGRKAFMGSNIKSAILPATSKISFGSDAFVDAKQLRELVIPSEKGFIWDGQFYGNNHHDFNCIIHYTYDNWLFDDSLSDYDYDSNGYYTCFDFVGVCFTPQGNTFNLGGLPFHFADSGLNAYEVHGVDNATGNLKTQKVTYTEEGSGGVIITDLTPGKLVKVRRNVGADYQDYNSNILKYSFNSMDLANTENSYYWDEINNRFVRVTGSHKIDPMRSYLVMAGNEPVYYLDILPTTVTGDVNGDGIVDVTDVNLTINNMLGKAFTPAADINGDGQVDVTDVNLIINHMLGK